MIITKIIIIMTIIIIMIITIMMIIMITIMIKLIILNSYFLACWWIVEIINPGRNCFPRATPVGQNQC